MTIQKCCPICGAITTKRLSSYPGMSDDELHRCRPKVLACIDGAMSTEDRAPADPSLHKRLSDGFAALSDDQP